MSLKSFHIFFIIISILMSLGFAWWSFREGHEIYAAVTSLLGMGLIVYLVYFLKKMKQEEFL